MKEIILNIENGVSREYKQSAKKAINEFIALFPEYKDKFKISVKENVDMSPYIKTNGDFNPSALSKDVNEKKYKALSNGKDDSDVPIQVFIPNRVLRTENNTFGFGIGSENSYIAASAASAHSADHLRRVIVHELGHLFEATYANRINTDAGSNEAQVYGTHCTTGGDIMSPYSHGKLETCDMQKPFCECCMGAIKLFMSRMRGLNEKVYPTISDEDARWLQANAEFKINTSGSVNIKGKDESVSYEKLEEVGRKIGWDASYPFSIIYKKCQELGSTCPVPAYELTPTKMPDNPIRIHSGTLPEQHSDIPIDPAFKKPLRAYWRGIATAEGSESKEDLKAKNFKITLTKTDGSSTTVEASSENNLSLSAKDSQGKAKIPDYKYFQDIVAYAKSKNSPVAFGDIKSPEFKARLLQACLEAKVKTIDEPKLDKKFMESIEAGTRKNLEKSKGTGSSKIDITGIVQKQAMRA